MVWHLTKGVSINKGFVRKKKKLKDRKNVGSVNNFKTDEFLSLVIFAMSIKSEVSCLFGYFRL